MRSHGWHRFPLALATITVVMLVAAACSAAATPAAQPTAAPAKPVATSASGAAAAPAATSAPAAPATTAAPAGAATSAPASAFTGPVVTVRLGDVVTEDNPEYKAHQFFAKRLSELTNGKYQVKMFMNSTLGGATQMNEQLRSGSLEMTKTGAAFLSTYDKRFSIWSLPYMFTSEQKLFAAQDGALGKAYADMAKQYGFLVLGEYYSGDRDIYNKKGPIKTPDDLKNMKIRLRTMPDPVMIDTINAMGAQATPLEAGEIYNAIQQGVVDGAENSITFYLTEKHNEVAPYFSLTHHFFSVDTFMVSLKWFNAQPAAAQQAILQAGKETIPYERQVWDQGDAANYEVAKKAGVKINEADVPAFQKAVQPVWDKYGPGMGELYTILKQSQ